MSKHKHSHSQPNYGSSQKRSHESHNSHKPLKQPKLEQPRVEEPEEEQPTMAQQEPRFSFDEVKLMIERILERCSRSSAAVSASLKKVDFDEIAVEGHSIHSCKELIEQLVQNTRRVRTLQEVLVDIKDNLKRRVYTEIIQRATLTEDLPRRPPSAYLLYHQDRYNELRAENSLAVEVSKIVAEEWKTLPEDRRRKYFRRHESLVRKYEEEMQRLGLVNETAPKRPRSAKALFIESNMSEIKVENYTKEELAARKERLAHKFDTLDGVEKQKWIQLHKEQLERYQLERDEYIAAHPHLDHAGPEKKPRSNQRVKPPEQPKSPFKFYCEKKLPELMAAGQSREDAKRDLKERFNRLREKKLLKYIKRAIQDKERYEAEVREFRRQHPGHEIPKTKANLTKEHYKLFSKVVENRPRLPAPTAYLHFCGKLLTEMVDTETAQVPTKRMQVASVAWKNASHKLKKANEREHIEDVERYILEMDAWLADQSEERRRQLFSEEPKSNPDYWRKKLTKVRKVDKKERITYINVV